MSISDKVTISCPQCGLKGTLTDFATWERDGKRGLLGKTREGYIMVLCPDCGNHIECDPLRDLSVWQKIFGKKGKAAIGIIAVGLLFSFTSGDWFRIMLLTACVLAVYLIPWLKVIRSILNLPPEDH